MRTVDQQTGIWRRPSEQIEATVRMTPRSGYGPQSGAVGRQRLYPTAIVPRLSSSPVAIAQSQLTVFTQMWLLGRHPRGYGV